MYKRTLMALLTIPFFGSELIAGTGSAYDAELFLVGIMVFLLTLAAILQGIDYLKKNGRKLLGTAWSYLRRKAQHLSLRSREPIHKSQTVQRA